MALSIAIPSSLPSAISGATATQSTTTVTVTKTSHGLVVGQLVRISGSPFYPGTYAIATTADANTFTYTAPNSATVSSTSIGVQALGRTVGAGNDTSAAIVIPKRLVPGNRTKIKVTCGSGTWTGSHKWVLTFAARVSPQADGSNDANYNAVLKDDASAAFSVTFDGTINSASNGIGVFVLTLPAHINNFKITATKTGTTAGPITVEVLTPDTPC